jgi:hypothetical protein
MDQRHHTSYQPLVIHYASLPSANVPSHHLLLPITLTYTRRMKTILASILPKASPNPSISDPICQRSTPPHLTQCPHSPASPPQSPSRITAINSRSFTPTAFAYPTPLPSPPPRVKLSLKDFALRKKKQREEEMTKLPVSISGARGWRDFLRDNYLPTHRPNPQPCTTFLYTTDSASYVQYILCITECYLIDSLPFWALSPAFTNITFFGKTSRS